MFRVLALVATSTLAVALQPSGRTCHSVSPAASDAWCNENCNHDPPNCPPSLCSCDAPGPSPPSPSPKGSPVVGGYLGLYTAQGLKGLEALAHNAASLPLTRITLAFVSAGLVYVPGSKTLIGAGMEIATTAPDAGFANVSAAIAMLKAGGVEVFLSMGGWDANCYPFMCASASIRPPASGRPQS